MLTLCNSDWLCTTITGQLITIVCQKIINMPRIDYNFIYTFHFVNKVFIAHRKIMILQNKTHQGVIDYGLNYHETKNSQSFLHVNTVHSARISPTIKHDYSNNIYKQEMLHWHNRLCCSLFNISSIFLQPPYQPTCSLQNFDW